MKAAWFSAVISGLSRESKLSISKSLNSFLLLFEYSIEVIWLYFFSFDWTLYYELLECVVLRYSAWSNWICFYLTFRMAKILRKGTGRSRKVLGSSGCGIALIISILLKTQLSFKAWNVHFLPFHVPICSLKFLILLLFDSLKYLTGSRHRTEAWTHWLKQLELSFP